MKTENSVTVDETGDENVVFYADGHSEEVNNRATECEHRVYGWHLHDADTDEWRKECIFCPAVLEQEFTKGSPVS